VCVFRACGGVLELCVVLLHKSVQKVLTHVLQRVRVHADDMKCVCIFLTRYTTFQGLKTNNMAYITHVNCYIKYDLKHTKQAKIVLEMHYRA